MRAGVLLILLLSVSAIGQTEGWGWLKTAFKAIKMAVSIAVNWVTDNCGQDNCSWTLRRRRDTGQLLDPQTQASQNQLCQRLMTNTLLLEEGFTLDLVRTIFETVDKKGDPEGEGDDILSPDEFTKFMETIEVFHHCFTTAG